jgi:hypothetical protein
VIALGSDAIDGIDALHRVLTLSAAVDTPVTITVLRRNELVQRTIVPHEAVHRN